MTRVRLLRKTTVKRGPSNPVEWERLLRKAIARAEMLQDRRVAGLKAALAQGKAEQALKRLGVIREEDLLREFPDNP